MDQAMKNNGFSLPAYECLNQDVPIRRFCTERVELDQEQGREDLEDPFNDLELWSLDHTGSPCQLGLVEEEGFIDSFINMDSYHGDDLTTSNPIENPQSCAGFEDLNNIETFLAVDDLYEEAPAIKGDEADTSCSLKNIGMAPAPSSKNGSNNEVDQGVQLVNLILACAEAVGCRDIQLATSLLHHVLVLATPWGDSLQRVSFSFAMGLKSRLSLLHNVGASGTFSSTEAMEVPVISREERKEAYQLLYQTTPYIAFGFMVANEAIYQAAQGKESIHIVDIGMQHALQWPSLIRTLASRPEGPPKLRITAITGDPHCFELDTNMKSLVNEASLHGISSEFHVIREPVIPSMLTSENLMLREGELLIVNSIMHLHKYVKESRGSLKTILQAIRKLNPGLLTIVDQDANHNGPFFLGRFLESLHYYSAIFDSLEASLPRSSQQRAKIERLHFAEEIRNIVACEGSDRVERHERADQWRRQLGRAGFQMVGLKSMSQVSMMLSVYGCDGYTLASEKGCLLLGWKGRTIIMASAWHVQNVLSP